MSQIFYKSDILQVGHFYKSDILQVGHLQLCSVPVHLVQMLYSVAARLLGQVGQCPTKNFQEKQFFLQKVIHSFSKTQERSLHFRSCPCGLLLRQGMLRIMKDLANHFNLFAINQ